VTDFDRFGVGVKAGVSGDDSWITFKALQLLFLFFFYSGYILEYSFSREG
jgi:hypothetical protein